MHIKSHLKVLSRHKKHLKAKEQLQKKKSTLITCISQYGQNFHRAILAFAITEVINHELGKHRCKVKL